MAIDKDIEDAFDLLCDIVDAYEFEKLLPKKNMTVRKIQKACRFLYSKQKVQIEEVNIIDSGVDSMAKF